MKSLLLSFVLLLLAGCDGVELTRDGDLVGRSLTQEIVLANQSDQEVFHFVVGRGLATRINWAPCITEENKIAPGSFINIQKSEIDQGENEKEVIVYWWRAIQVNGEVQAGEVQHFILEI